MSECLPFVDGPLSGKKIKFSKAYTPYIVFENSLYITVYEGYERIADHYKYIGRITNIKQEDLI
jgi:hypothetical protein